jgi:sortase A
VRVEAPAARINAPVVESYLDQNEAIYVPLNEAGHYINSARPGEKGNMVIVGHVRRGLVFNRLVNLKLNDLISIYDEVGKRYDYKVAQIELLPAAGASQEQIQTGLLYTSPTSDERVSLITCYPETSYADRLVVIGVPVKFGEVAR